MPADAADALTAAEANLALAALSNHPESAVGVSLAVAEHLGAFDEHALDVETAIASRFDERIVQHSDPAQD